MDLEFQLERGGSDGFRRPPIVWRVDDAFSLDSLQRRFAADWLDWYGPVLRPHGLVIADQLARCAAAQFGQASAAPRWWALPVVRRRSRRLRVGVPARGAGAAPSPLGLVLHQFWGAGSDQAMQPGPAVWCACPDRQALPAITLPALQQRGPGEPVEHRLFDGVGLLVLLPTLPHREVPQDAHMG